MPHFIAGKANFSPLLSPLVMKGVSLFSSCSSMTQLLWWPLSRCDGEGCEVEKWARRLGRTAYNSLVNEAFSLIPKDASSALL